MFLYENEAGALFDSYVWTRFELRELVIKQEIVSDGTGSKVRFIYDRNDIMKLIAPTDKPHFSTDYFGREEAGELLADLAVKKTQ